MPNPFPPLIAGFVSLGFFLGLCALSAQDIGGKPLEKWIEALGDPEFDIRETASRRLTEAGEKAIPLLEKARKSEDPEIRHRAGEILESFRFGILPETPSHVRGVMVELRRQPSEDGKRREIRKLLGFGDIGIKSISRLVRLSQVDEESKPFLMAVIKEFPLAVGLAMKQGKAADLAELIEAFAKRDEDSLPEEYFRYAAAWDWILQEPQLGAASLGHAKAKPVLLADPGRSWSFAFGKRVQRQYAESGKAVLQAKGREVLRKGFLLESGMWKDVIHALDHDGQLDNDEPEYYSMMCTMQHLLGNEKAFEETYEKYSRHREAGVTSGPEKIPANLKLLFLNDRPEKALAKLKESSALSSLFQIQVARHEVAQAMELAGPVTELQLKEMALDLAIHRARILAVLGKKKEARDQLIALKPRVNPRMEPNSPMPFPELFLEAAQFDSELLTQTLLSWLDEGIGPEVGTKLILKATSSDEEKSAGLGRLVHGVLTAKTTTAEAKSQTIDLLWGKLKKEAAQARIDALLKSLSSLDERAFPEGFRRSALLQLSRIADFYKLPATRQEILRMRVDLEFRLELIDHHLDQNQIPPAVALVNELLDKEPQSPKVWFALAKLRLKEKSPDFPRVMATAMLMGAADIAILTDQVATFLDLDEKRFGFLLPQFAVATSIPGTYENGKAYRMASRVMTQRKLYEESAHALLQSQLRAAHPDIYFVSVTANLGAPVNHHRQRLMAALVRSDDGETKKRTEAILKYFPYDVDLPIALLDHGKTELARSLFEAQYVKARDHYRTLIKTYGESGWLLNSLAWMMACCGKDLPEAVEHARAATKSDPTRAGYWDTLAEALFQNGQKEEAVAAITKAIELNSEKVYYQRQKKRMEKGDKTTPRPDEDEGD